MTDPLTSAPRPAPSAPFCSPFLPMTGVLWHATIAVASYRISVTREKSSQGNLKIMTQRSPKGNPIINLHSLTLHTLK